MMISRNDIVKTLMIVWFVATTGYVIADLYIGYRVRGIQAAYQNGYASSVSDFVKKLQDNKCQPVEIKKNENEKIQVIDVQCLKQQQEQQGPQNSSQPQAGQSKK
jgi:hypothetical protein